jgi:hypothetical protein
MGHIPSSGQIARAPPHLFLYPERTGVSAASDNEPGRLGVI